ncbi:hypothetical protein IFR05_007690 [Cadophora sp. M221]|nr:hypothetical protein IFR05_007690 [Cadophora sp. M221]
MSFWSTATTKGSEPSLSFSYVSNSNQVCQSSIAGTGAEMFRPQTGPSSDAAQVEWNDKDIQTAHGDDGFGRSSVEWRMLPELNVSAGTWMSGRYQGDEGIESPEWANRFKVSDGYCGTNRG